MILTADNIKEELKPGDHVVIDGRGPFIVMSCYWEVTADPTDTGFKINSDFEHGIISSYEVDNNSFHIERV